ncbi:MAG: Ig-like domain repeat protein [Acidimicrobiales bacterium]
MDGHDRRRAGRPAPTGTVELWSGTTHLASAPLTGGAASVTVAAPAVTGAWVVTATYNGDLSYEPATTTASVTVAAAATTTLAATATGFVADPILLGALVTSTATAGPIGGQVRFSVDSPGFSPLTVAVDGAGWAQVAATGIPAGTWTVTATYEPPPGSAYATSSGTASIQVARRPARLTLAAPPAVTVGQPFDVTFALADAGGSGPTPAGDVTVSGGGASCTGTAASGRCSLTVATAGGVTLTATSSGDATYARPRRVRWPSPQPGHVDAHGVERHRTWVSGDPITVAWRLTGPPSGEVVLRSPLGRSADRRCASGRAPPRSRSPCAVRRFRSMSPTAEAPAGRPPPPP